MAMLVGFVLRLIFILGSHGLMNHDLSAWLEVGNLTLTGTSIFPEPAPTKAPYFPLLIYMMSGSVWLQQFGIDAVDIMKTVVAAFDTGIIYLIYRITKNQKAALLYALNPISILIIGIHGQIDAIPLSMLLLALYLQKYTIISLWVSSLAIAMKTWPFIFLIPLYKQLKNRKLLLILTVIPIAMTLLYSVIFSVSILDILKPVMQHRGLYGVYGVSLVLKSMTNSHIIELLVSKLFPLVLIGYMLRSQKTDIYTQILYGMFFFFTFTPTFGIQWLIWLMPFLIITRHSHRFWYMLTGTVYLMGAYLQWSYPGFGVESYEAFLVIMGFVMWTVIVFIWGYGRTHNRF
jgi:hypothetical protein